MKKAFIVKQARERAFTLNPNVEITDELKKNLQVGVLPVLAYKSGEDVVYMHVFLKYKSEKTEILSFGISLAVDVDGWSKQVDEVEDVSKTEMASRLLGYSLGYLSAALSSHISFTPLAGMYLPIANVEEIIPSMKIEKLSEP